MYRNDASDEIAALCIGSFFCINKLTEYLQWNPMKYVHGLFLFLSLRLDIPSMSIHAINLPIFIRVVLPALKQLNEFASDNEVIFNFISKVNHLKTRTACIYLGMYCIVLLRKT